MDAEGKYHFAEGDIKLSAFDELNGNAELQFSPADLANSDMNVAVERKGENGQFAAYTDYENPQPGTYRFKVDGLNNYEGTLYSDEFTFIERYDLSFAAADEYSQDKLESITVGGKAVTPDAETGLAGQIAPKTEVKLVAKRGYVIEKAEGSAPATPHVTFNEGKTEATFEMPAQDITVGYQLKRDMSLDMAAIIGDGSDVVRMRVTKDGDKFVPAEMSLEDVRKMLRVHDNIEEADLNLTQDCNLNIFSLDKDDQPAGAPKNFFDFDFAVGRYAVQAEGVGNYKGVTALSNILDVYYKVITKKPVALQNLIYTGSPIVLIEPAECEGGEMRYSIDGGENWTAELPEATEPDTYTVCYKVVADENDTDPEYETLDVVIYQRLAVDEIAAEVVAAPGENVELTANITSGVAPFTVIWTDAQGTPIDETIIAAEPGEYGYSVIAEGDAAYSVSVTDSLGQQFTADVQLTVAGRGLVADFENLPLERESYWNGSDGKGQFVSGGFRFENGYYENAYGSYSYGFAYSNMTASTFATYAEDRYNSCVGGGVDGSENFAVYSMVKGYKKGVQVFGVAEGDSVTGFYVTNTASAYKAMSEGSDLARKFAAGDWFKLTVTGIDCNGQETGTVEYYLADFRDPQQSYIISDWRWVDLSTLGRVKRLEFSLSSTDNGKWSMNTPAYFCVDNLGGEKPEYEEPIITSISTVAPQQDVVPVGVYSVSGAPQQGLQPGVNIVKYSDGSTKKILVK